MVSVAHMISKRMRLIIKKNRYGIVGGWAIKRVIARGGVLGVVVLFPMPGFCSGFFFFPFWFGRVRGSMFGFMDCHLGVVLPIVGKVKRPLALGAGVETASVFS